MKRAWKNLAWLCVATTMGLGCAEDTAAVAGACGGSALPGHYLWNVGNCESGTLTPVSATTCETTLCGGNARELDECVGDKLFELTVNGVVVTGEGVAEPMEFTRDLVCARDFPDDIVGCEQVRCLIDHDPDFFLQRFPARPVGEQFVPDGMWFAMDKPWPGRDQCGVDVEADARLQQLDMACPF